MQASRKRASEARFGVPAVDKSRGDDAEAGIW